MLRFKVLFVLLCSLFSISIHAGWSTSVPGLISPLTNTETESNVYISFNPTTGQFLATWADFDNNNTPTYSFYTPGSGWGPIGTIPYDPLTSPTYALANVINSYDPVTEKYLATWTDNNNSNLPTYSVYTPGTGWGYAAVIPTASNMDLNDISNISINGQFLLTWADINNTPSYAFYNPDAGWTSNPIQEFPTTIDTSMAFGVYATFDPNTGNILAAWDQGNGYPAVSLYSSGAWGTAAVVNDSSVESYVFLTSNPATGQFLLAWSDINNSNFPTYSIYTPGSGWSAYDTITESSTVNQDVTVSYALSTGQFLALWNDLNTGASTYSFYTQGSGWSAPAVIEGSTSGGDTNSSYDSITGQFLATWGNNIPSYSFFTYIPPAPSSFVGSVIRNRFLTQTDIVNVLTWAPPSDSSIITSYQITRNGDVIATVPASGPYVYNDHNRPKNQVDVYTIISIDSFGVQSSPVVVVFNN